ncbi:MAG: aspartate kinase [Lachnospiraceae bacterium]
MLVVKKFGGTSVADPQRIRTVAKRCAEDYRAGRDVIVVLSAMGKTTDVILELAKEVNPDAPKRELDMLLAIGEQTSVALMSMAFAAMGIPAVSLNAFQVPMHTTGDYGNARIKKIGTDRVRHELESRKIVVITGFQGINRYDDVTTIGRGGSDTTAVALAAALHADACEIYTDVEGVFTADPRIVPNARKLKEITYDEMLELASIGAQVLHNRSVELAKKYGVTLVVRSSLNTNEGTIVREEAEVESMLISGVAADKNTARITVMGLKDEPGIAFKVFDLLANHSVNVDAILQSVGPQIGKREISFIVPRDCARNALEVLEQNKSRLKAETIDVDCTVAKLSVVGAGIQTNPGVAAKMFESLYNVGVNILMIATSEVRITVIIREEDVEKAVRAVHDALVD